MTTIQLTNVPVEISQALEAKAALQGASLSEYLLDELKQLAKRPSRAELFARIKARGVAEIPPAADVLAAERENHLNNKMR